jgi:ParB family chromosome partitioning protein
VTRVEDGYQLIAGERRWRASRLAGLSVVPVVVKDVSSHQVLEIALVENVQREDLNPLEEATAYRQLIEEFGLTHEEVARRVGKSRSAISNTLRLLNAAGPIKEALLKGKVSEGHARALLALETEDAQVSALRIVQRRHLSVRQTEELVQKLLSVGTVQRGTTPPSPEIQAVETQLREALGTKVRLTKGKKGGRVIIYYYSEEELDFIYQRITGADNYGT